MEYVPRDEFLARAARQGIAPDARYAEPRCLTYVPDRALHRFWPVPPRADHLPSFVGHLLDTIEPWSSCDLWSRNGWRHAAGSFRVEGAVAGLMLRAAGIIAEHDGAVRYSADERAPLTTLVATMVFGWTTSHDYFVVPDHGRHILHFDSHEAVHVRFAGAGDVTPLVARMATAGYPLPNDLPDATFKRPDWML